MPIWKRKGKSRSEEMQSAAYELGMQYDDEDRLQVLPLLQDFKLFKTGHSRKIKHLLWENDPMREVSVRIFDYQFTVSSGNTHQTFKQSVFFVNSKRLGLPELYLKPEHFFHKVAAWLGWDDIDFESHETFSSQYLLKGQEESIIRDTFSDEVLHFFTLEKGWYLEGINYYMVLYKKRKLLDKAQIADIYKKGHFLLERLSEGGYRV